MKTGDRVEVRVTGLTGWIEGRVELASSNGVSIIITVDEGIPAPFGLLGGRQALVIMNEPGNCREIQAN
jgi:hypothetical protein